MQARLKVLHDKANVKQVKLLPVTLIGRSTECNLKIASSQVSRAHCRITLGEDTVYVEDLGSANGTMVDGKLLVAHQPTSVLPGATLIVGPAEFLIDYVASTSATMVLSRFEVPLAPSLSSTELLLPTKRDVPAHSVAPTASQPTPPVAVAAVPVAKPVAAPVVAAPVSVPVVAKPAVTAVAQATPVVAVQPAMPVVAQAVPVPIAVAPSPVAAPEAPPVEMIFAGFASSTDEPVTDEATQFMFGEPNSLSDLPTSFAEPKATSATSKKGGMKSLFSLFGRTAKGITEATSPAEASTGNSNAPPSVFLPTMDQVETDASLAATDAEPNRFSFGDPATVESTAATITFEPPQATTNPASGEAPADEEDGFQQFLKQL